MIPVAAATPTFGVEEEYLFLHPRTLEIADEGEEILHTLRNDNRCAELAHAEFLASQLEYSSPVFINLESARNSITSFRTEVARAASERDLLVTSTGVPFITHGMPQLSTDPRYRRIAAAFGGIIIEHQITALHVHVAVPDRERGVLALNRIRPWLATLAALAGNSPFRHGEDSGFASWRTILMRRWTTAGPPPEFQDADDYDHRIRSLVGIGGTVDLASIAWSARLSENHPTLEVRVCDAQLEIADTLCLAAVIRALVSTALNQAEHGWGAIRCEPELLDAAHWHAGRHGISNELLDPVAGALVPADEAVYGMLAWCADALAAAGDEDQVNAGIRRIFRDGTGADRQRMAFHAGALPLLRSVLHDSFLAPASPPA